MRKNERVFCIASDKIQKGGHTLPLYRVDENGRGVEFGYAGVLVVREWEAVIEMIEGMALEGSVEASMSLEVRCLYYEIEDAEEEMERGSYEIVNKILSSLWV